MWLIWCHERGQWWGPAERGYTADITQAGRYTFDRAEQICQQANQGILFGRPIQETIVRAPEDQSEDPVAEFTLERFHNALRIFLNIDMTKLEEAGVLEVDDMDEWREFQKSPWRWFIRADDETCRKLWKCMMERGMMK